MSLYVHEVKSTSESIELGGTYVKRTRLDLQIGVYIAAAKHLGYEPIGVMYDVLHKPALRPLQATPVDARKFTKKTGELYATQRLEDEMPEAYGRRVMDAIVSDPARYYARFVVVRLEDEERQVAFDVWQTAVAMRDAKRLKMYPRNPDACVGWGRECDFFKICCGEADADDSMLYSRSSVEHEELELEPSAIARTTQSAMRTYRSCPRKYKLRYQDGVRPLTKPEPLKTGTSLHRAVETLCKTSSLELAVAALDQDDPYRFAKERAMIVGYVARWGMPKGFFAVEKQFEMPLINPETGAPSRTYMIAGKLDSMWEGELETQVTTPAPAPEWMTP